MQAINWIDWYEQPPIAVEYLERTRDVLREAGFTDDPETVLEVGRYLLSDPKAPEKLRDLADAWEAHGERAPWLELVKTPG